MNREISKERLKNRIDMIKNMSKNEFSFHTFCLRFSQSDYISYLENEFETDIQNLKTYINQNTDKYVWSMGTPIKGIDRINWSKFHFTFERIAESLGECYDLGFKIPEPGSFLSGHSVSGGFKYTFDGLNMYSAMSMDVHDLHMYIFTVEK